MTRKAKAPAGRDDTRPVPEPVDVTDGIPDRAASRPAWKYVVLAAVFLAWVAFLIYCQLAGNLAE